MIEAALDLFERRGFDHVTVDEIADAAHVSPRTFFRYFGSKEAVLFHDQDEMLELLRSTIEAQPAGVPPLRALRTAVLALGDYAAQDLDAQTRKAQVVREASDTTTYERTVLQPAFEEVLAEALAAHLGVPANVDPRPRLLAGVGISVMNAVSAQWWAAGGGDFQVMLEEAFDALRSAAADS